MIRGHVLMKVYETGFSYCYIVSNNTMIEGEIIKNDLDE